MEAFKSASSWTTERHFLLDLILSGPYFRGHIIFFKVGTMFIIIFMGTVYVVDHNSHNEGRTLAILICM